MPQREQIHRRNNEAGLPTGMFGVHFSKIGTVSEFGVVVLTVVGLVSGDEAVATVVESNGAVLVDVDLVASITASTMQITSKPMAMAIIATTNHLELKHEFCLVFLQSG